MTLVLSLPLTITYIEYTFLALLSITIVLSPLAQPIDNGVRNGWVHKIPSTMAGLASILQSIKVNVIGTLFGVLIEGTIISILQYNGTLSSWWTRIGVGVLTLIFIGIQSLFYLRRKHS